VQFPDPEEPLAYGGEDHQDHHSREPLESIGPEAHLFDISYHDAGPQKRLQFVDVMSAI
jgi:hypothetical protein